MVDYERLRRFAGYVSWSERIIDIWNDAVSIKSRIRFATREEATRNEDRWKREISRIWARNTSLFESISKAMWFNLPIDITSVRKADNRRWLPYFVSEGITFETLHANINFLLADAISELEEKIIVVIPPEEEYIGIDAETGHDIYYNRRTREYVLRDKKTKKEIRRSTYLEVDETVSIDTGEGHDIPFVAEVTGSTRVRRMGRAELDMWEREFQTTLDKFFHSQKGFDQIKSRAMKKGVEYKIGGKAPDWNEVDVVIEKKEPRVGKYEYKRVRM